MVVFNRPPLALSTRIRFQKFALTEWKYCVHTIQHDRFLIVLSVHTKTIKATAAFNLLLRMCKMRYLHSKIPIRTTIRSVDILHSFKVDWDWNHMTNRWIRPVHTKTVALRCEIFLIWRELPKVCIFIVLYGRELTVVAQVKLSKRGRFGVFSFQITRHLGSECCIYKRWWWTNMTCL